MIDPARLLARDDGFTLVETIVAFLVLASAMVIATQTVSLATTGLRTAEESDAVIEAADWTHLVALPKLIHAGGLSQEGLYKDAHWTIELVPVNGKPYRADQFRGFARIQIRPQSSTRAPYRFLYFENQVAP